jgi:hypothetical protein
MDGNRQPNSQHLEIQLVFNHIRYFQPMPLLLSSTEFHRVVLCRVANVANRCPCVAIGFDNSELEHRELCTKHKVFLGLGQSKGELPPLKVQSVVARPTDKKAEPRLHCHESRSILFVGEF